VTDTFYARVGGRPWFEALVERFYARVATDAVLRPLYPDDLTEAKRHLVSFLVQVGEGPREYERTRGAPRLRLRHAPFRIGLNEREAWFRHMRESVREAALRPDDEADLLAYFARMATHMINSAE
jgi:hemoglobin